MGSALSKDDTNGTSWWETFRSFPINLNLKITELKHEHYTKKIGKSGHNYTINLSILDSDSSA